MFLVGMIGIIIYNGKLLGFGIFVIIVIIFFNWVEVCWYKINLYVFWR